MQQINKYHPKIYPVIIAFTFKIKRNNSTSSFADRIDLRDFQEQPCLEMFTKLSQVGSRNNPRYATIYTKEDKNSHGEDKADAEVLDESLPSRTVEPQKMYPRMKASFRGQPSTHKVQPTRRVTFHSASREEIASGNCGDPPSQREMNATKNHNPHSYLCTPQTSLQSELQHHFCNYSSSTVTALYPIFLDAPQTVIFPPELMLASPKERTPLHLSFQTGVSEKALAPYLGMCQTVFPPTWTNGKQVRNQPDHLFSPPWHLQPGTISFLGSYYEGQCYPAYPHASKVQQRQATSSLVCQRGAVNFSISKIYPWESWEVNKPTPFPQEKKDKTKYECHICAKAFGQLSNLKVIEHINIHMRGNTPWSNSPPRPKSAPPC